MRRTPEQRAAHAELVAGTARGDHAAFEGLYDEFADLVYSIAMSMLRDAGSAEDATQDIWVRVWNAAGSFDAERASVATWISTVAHRHVIDLLRRDSARPGDRGNREPGDEIASRLAGGADTEREATDAVMVETIRAAMAGLSEGQRRSIELAYLDGLTQREIAERLGKPLGTVKTYMFQGMRRLGELLDSPKVTTSRQEGPPPDG